MNTKTEPEVVYQEVALQTVLDFYAKGFDVGADKKARLMDTFVDSSKSKVVFKLLVSDS